MNLETLKTLSVVNLTPHEINLVVGDEVLSFPPSGEVARVETEFIPMSDVFGYNQHGDIEGLPAPQAGDMYLVSSFVFAAGNRIDVIAPDTSPQGAIRNDAGQIVGVRRFLSSNVLPYFSPKEKS